MWPFNVIEFHMQNSRLGSKWNRMYGNESVTISWLINDIHIFGNDRSFGHVLQVWEIEKEYLPLSTELLLTS